jgi:uncharacterized membrane protein YqjE
MSVRPGAPTAGGLLDAVRAIGTTLNEIVRLRGALFAIELGEEVERRKHALILAGLAAAFLHMALMLLTLFVVVIFWDTHRVAAIGVVALLYLACGAGALIRYRMHGARSPSPFEATLGELQQDLAQLRAPR